MALLDDAIAATAARICRAHGTFERCARCNAIVTVPRGRERATWATGARAGDTVLCQNGRDCMLRLRRRRRSP